MTKFIKNIVPVITSDPDNKKVVNLFKWGFPNFKQQSTSIINARAETLEEKPTFKKILHTQKCIVPCTGFYEWKKVNDKKVKHLIQTNDQQLFYMAGLYSTFKDKGGNSFTAFVIITTEPNNKIAEIHNRMPVILKRDMIDTWLNNTNKMLAEFFIPYKNESIEISIA